jgi:hypothetical protein
MISGEYERAYSISCAPLFYGLMWPINSDESFEVFSMNFGKLIDLAADYGYTDVDELLGAAMFDSVCPGICMNEDCDYSTEVEPDQERGWCENCGTNTVVSALMLAGVI